MNNIIKTELAGSKLALMDEYKKAVDDLISVIQPITSDELVKIIDPKTVDLDCKSIQTILSHVVCSGFGYVIYIENSVGIKKERLEKKFYNITNEYIEDLKLMFEYALVFFQNHAQLEIEQFDNTKKIKVNWGQYYDIEQLIEHAIVHVLRHRRQIEKFIIQINQDNKEK
jgi:hypothetical protein